MTIIHRNDTLQRSAIWDGGYPGTAPVKHTAAVRNLGISPQERPTDDLSQLERQYDRLLSVVAGGLFGLVLTIGVLFTADAEDPSPVPALHSASVVVQ